MTRSVNKGIFFVLITALISGVSIFINKLAITGLNPYFFTGVKNALVAFFLLAVLVKTKQLAAFKKMPFGDWLRLFLIGLIGGSLPFLLFFKGLAQTSAANAAFIHKNLFLFAAVLAPLFLKEKLKKNFFLAAGLLLLGNALLFRIFSFYPQKGDLLILLAAFLWAVENILSKKVLGRLSPQVVAFGRMFFGSVLIGLFLALNPSFLAVGSIHFSQIKWILMTSFFLLAYVTTWYTGLKYAPVTLATSLLTIGSPITTLLSLAFLGVSLDLGQVGGLVFLALGAAVLLKLKKGLVNVGFETRRAV